MELWIRSQDKDSLIKTEKIELIYDYLCSENIQLIHIETDKGRIGSYSTQERALEVLDEIETAIAYCSCDLPDEIKEIKKKIKSCFAMNLKTNSIVYEMPKE